MNAPREAPSRIVVAFGSDTTSEVSVDIAQHLLRDVATELVGVLVEDHRLLAHATAALALEIGYSGRARALESERIERQLRARAADTRRRFEASASELKMRHDFRVLRGDVATELLRAATSAEALLLARNEWRTGRGIVAAVEHEAHAARVVEIGLRLAERSRSPLALLVAGEMQAQRHSLAETARALAAAAGVELQSVLAAADLTLETIARAARGARLFVMPRRADAEMATLLAELLAETPLPLLMLGDHGGARDS